MAVTSNLKAIADRLVQQNKIGFVLSDLSGTSSTLTQATVGSSQLRGPTTGRAIPINSPILITAGAATTGTSTATGTTSLTDGLAAWIANTFVGETITAGSSTAVVVSNTTTAITVAAWTGGTPAAIGAYSISFTPGEDTYVSDWVPSTGVITVSPVIQQGATDAVLITEKDIKHGDWLMEAISRAVTDRMARWQQTPLTFVPDGDLRGTTVTDYWTGINCTPSYVTPTWPAGSAHAFDFSGVQRVLNVDTTNASNSLSSSTIDVALNSTVSSYQWYFQTAMRLRFPGTPGGTVTMRAWDTTNNVAITANVIAGSDTFTHTTDSQGFINIEGTLNIPATCKQFEFRWFTTTDEATYQFTPVVAYPVDALTFPIPNRIESEEFIGNFHYATQASGTSGPYSVAYSEPITTDGGTHHLSNFGDHMNVTFNFRPWRPVYFDELVSDPDLTSWTSTTTFPLDQVCKWTRFELFDTLNWAEPEPVPPARPKWRTKRNAALQVAQGSVFEPEMIQVLGRI